MEKRMKGLLRKVIPAIAIIVIALFNSSAHAVAQCKSLSKSQCAANNDCTWVSGYTTKTGKKVDAYCRVKSGKKTASGKSSKSTKSEAEDKPKKEQKAKAKKTEKGSTKDQSKKEK
jgi:hypothetical protein